MSPDDHRHYRKVFQDAFRDDAVDACLPGIEAIIAAGLARIAEASSSDPETGLALRSHLEPIVLKACLLLFLGLTPDSADADDAQSRFAVIGHDVGGPPGSPRAGEVASAADEIVTLMRRHESAISSGLENSIDAPPSFLAALLRSDPGALDDPTIALNFVFLLRTAASDLTGLLHWIVKLLGDNREWLGAVRSSPDASELAKRVVMETLRLEQSEMIYRTARADLDVGGFVVPAGWHLRVCVRESHQDPAVFDDPKRFDPDRFKQRYNRKEYAPLGALGHTCLGVRTIFAVAGSFVQELAGGYDLDVISDGPPEFSALWRPSRRHRIVVRPLAARPGP